MKKLLISLLFLFGFLAAQAQTTVTQTTLSSAMTTTAGQFVGVTSATGISASIQSPTVILVDQELMDVKGLNGTTLTVIRGYGGTKGQTHLTGATVYVGPPNAFGASDPAEGSCTASNSLFLPLINFRTGTRWNCIAGQWMVDNGEFDLPASACFGAVSGNSTGTNGYTTAGTSLTPVVQDQTSATGTNTHSYLCKITIPSWLAGKGAALTDVVFKYGVQQASLGTQVATLASGTINSVVVFGSIAYPAPGASETASTVAPVRADAGTLLITPVVASFNTGTTTAGGFFTAKFTPATALPIPANGTDLKELYVNITLQCSATTATTTNSPGLTVHYAYIPSSF